MLLRNNLVIMGCMRKGFTLVEVLLMVAIVVISVAIVVLAINPNTQLAEARNAQRKVDINTISNAVYQYRIGNNGTVPSTITVTPTAICKTGASCAGLVDLSVLTTGERYLVSMPFDPSAATTNSTNYSIYGSANGKVTVAAPGAENGVTITVTR